MKDKIDVCSYISNKENREYLKKYKCFSPLDKARIIIFSFRPMEDKIEALKTLSKEIDSEDKYVIIDVYRLLFEALDTIYNPSPDHIFNISRRNSYWDEVRSNPYERSINSSLGRLYKSFEDYISEYEVTEEDKADNRYSSDDYHEKYDYIYGEVSSINAIKKDYYEDISFESAYFGGHIRIYHITVSDEWAMKRGYSEEVADMIRVSNIDRYSLPYKYGESVMLKTPFMAEPMYGGLYSSMDGNGCWYHFFKYDNGKSVEMIDLSYHEIGFCDHLTVFDWLYKSNKELTPAVKDELFGKDYMCFTKCTKLVDIKEEGYGYVYCTASILDIKECSLDVILTDDSGSMKGRMCVFKDDIKWIEELEETGEKLFICGHFIKDSDADSMFMDFHCDIERLPEHFMKNICSD